jgi:tetratricopeptide (TPR) repeat protein
MEDPGAPTSPNAPASTEDLEKQLLPLLKAKERHKIIETFLKDELELPGYQAKLAAKIILPSLEKLFGKAVAGHLENAHKALSKRFDKYDSVAQSIGQWFSYRLEPSKAKGAILKKLTAPPEGIKQKDWDRFNEQTQVWIKQLSQLEQISLLLGNLSVSVSLNIDQPIDLKGKAPSFWLRPYNDFIPMKGREPFIDHLKAFCSADQFFNWTLLTGDGGIGKTRLALEFVKIQQGNGWYTGFLQQDKLARLVRHPGFDNWEPLTDTLMVVDYAADKIEDLKLLMIQCSRLAAAGNGKDGQAKLRLLLLERHGTPSDGWLKDLLSAGKGAQRDLIGLSLIPPQKLKAPETESPDAAMLDILRLTMQNWQEFTGKKAPQLPKFDDSDLASFRGNTQMRPLFVQMAGIHACETGDALGLFRWTQEDLLTAAVERERIYIRDKCPDKNLLPCLERLVALLSFTGPQSFKSPEWMDLISQDATACGYPGLQPGEVNKAAKDLLGEEEGGITPLAPDILAAAYSVKVLKQNQETVHRLIKDSLNLVGLDAWSRLLRAVIDLYHVESLSIVEQWLLDNIPDLSYEKLLEVENLIEKVSVAHRKALAELNETLLRKLPRNDEFEENAARIYNNLSYAYSYLGRREDALGAAERAMEIYERLAKRNPDAFESDLASSLNNLGSFYSYLGRREEALGAAERAVEIRERLAKRNPDAFEPDLAMSLNNLGNSYSDLGRREEALGAAERAVEIYERLAKRNPDAFEPDLASSLNNLGNRYSDLGRREEALGAAERAVEIRERLAKRNPDAFEPDLASSLNNLGSFYSDLGRREEALGAAERAVEIYERLAKRNPDAFEPDLASSLNNLGSFYSDLGRREEALGAAERAVEIRERLAKRNPDAFEPDLASSLNNLGNILQLSWPPRGSAGSSRTGGGDL